jgi:hypothetical protein
MPWYYAILLAIFIVIVLPVLFKTYYWDAKFGKLRPIPDIFEMPDAILSSRGVTDWEEGFAIDMKEKLQDEKFVNKITRKQCVKLIEVYLERTRGVKKKEIDMDNIKIVLGGRIIQ